MAFGFRRKHEAAEELRRIVAEQVDRTIDALRDTQADHEERVHEARQRLKRVRAMLRLARPVMSADWFATENAAYRDIADGLSSTRDADVMIRTFDSLAPTPSQELRRIRDALVAYRQTLAHQANVTSQAAQALEQTRCRIDTWAVPTGGFELIEEGLTATYRQGRKRMAAAFDAPSDERFHDWRKRVKSTMHHLRVLRRACPAMLNSHRDGLDELGDVLGEDHDLAVLRATVDAADHPLGTARARRRLATLIDERRQTLWVRARELGDWIYAEKPSALARRVRTYWQTWRHETPQLEPADVTPGSTPGSMPGSTPAPQATPVNPSSIAA